MLLCLQVGTIAFTPTRRYTRLHSCMTLHLHASTCPLVNLPSIPSCIQRAKHTNTLIYRLLHLETSSIPTRGHTHLHACTPPHLDVLMTSYPRADTPSYLHFFTPARLHTHTLTSLHTSMPRYTWHTNIHACT